MRGKPVEMLETRRGRVLEWGKLFREVGISACLGGKVVVNRDWVPWKRGRVLGGRSMN